MECHGVEAPATRSVAGAHQRSTSSRKDPYVGILDAPAWWSEQAKTLAQLCGWSPTIALQIEYCLIERTVEPERNPMKPSDCKVQRYRDGGARFTKPQ
jgi:hypothetical protein